MPNAIPVDAWLDVLEREYLNTYIAEGGAAVKLAVTTDTGRRQLSQRLSERCTKGEYLLVEVDAKDCRAHMPQDLFYALANHIDWRALARRRVLELAAGRGFLVNGIERAGGNLVEAIAMANRLTPQAVLLELRPAVQDAVLANPNMARDFRTAMFHLCIIEFTAGGEEYGGRPLIDWLTGVNPRIGNLRPFAVHTPINRTTARYFIESALHWVAKCGHAGTVLLFDNSRVTVARNPRDGARYYTRAMAIDHYELLREFVDDIDRLSNALIVVATSYDFVDDEAARGWRIYDALRTRVMDDVRDRHHVNPVAALVRLGDGGETS